VQRRAEVDRLAIAWRDTTECVRERLRQHPFGINLDTLHPIPLCRHQTICPYSSEITIATLNEAFSFDEVL
jgi:hypothetical protein